MYIFAPAELSIPAELQLFQRTYEMYSVLEIFQEFQKSKQTMTMQEVVTLLQTQKRQQNRHIEI